MNHTMPQRQKTPRPPWPRDIELRAWRRTIEHLTARGMPPLGVPLDVILELYAEGDDRLRRSLDVLWAAA